MVIKISNQRQLITILAMFHTIFTNKRGITFSSVHLFVLLVFASIIIVSYFFYKQDLKEGQEK